MSKQIGILSAALTIAAAAAFVLTWSSGFLVAAIATVDVPPTTLLVWRFVPVAVVLLLVVRASGSARGVTRAQLGTQAVIGLFAQFGYCAFVYGSIAVGITTGTTALIDAVQPLVVATLVGPLLGLRVRGAQWAGLGIGAAGVVLVVQSQIGGSDAAADRLHPAGPRDGLPHRRHVRRAPRSGTTARARDTDDSRVRDGGRHDPARGRRPARSCPRHPSRSGSRPCSPRSCRPSRHTACTGGCCAASA